MPRQQLQQGRSLCPRRQLLQLLLLQPVLRLLQVLQLLLLLRRGRCGATRRLGIALFLTGQVPAAGTPLPLHAAEERHKAADPEREKEGGKRSGEEG